MKQILLLITTAILSFSCLPSVKYIEPWDHVSMKVNNSTNPTQLTNTEIVKQATLIQNFNNSSGMPGDNIWKYTITDANRKPESNSFQFPGTFVFNNAGLLNPMYLLSKNILLIRSIENKLDTIAFIPRSTIKTAKIEIENAYNEKREEDCYKIFEQMMIFTPITGAEFKKLEANNLN